MAEIKIQVLEERKIEKRTFKEDTAFARLQDRITELELKIEELELT